MPLPSPTPQHNHRTTCGNQCSTNTNDLTCLNQDLPPARRALAELSLSEAELLSQKTEANAHVASPDVGVCGVSWQWWQEVSFHNQTRAHLFKTHHIQARDQTLPTTGKEPLQIAGLKDKMARTKEQSLQSIHWSHFQKHEALGNRGYHMDHMAGHYRTFSS